MKRITRFINGLSQEDRNFMIMAIIVTPIVLGFITYAILNS